MTSTNYDALVGSDGYVGIKTGSDSAAGGCLLFAKRVTVAGRRLTILGAVLGQREGAYVPAALASAQALGDSAAVALRAGTVLPAGSEVLMVSGVDGRHTRVVTASALREIGWGGLTVPVSVALAAHAATRLAEGQQVATVSVERLERGLQQSRRRARPAGAVAGLAPATPALRAAARPVSGRSRDASIAPALVIHRADR